MINTTETTMGANPKLEDLQNFLNENFDFRYNVLTDMPECKPKNTTTYRMIDKRMMNTLSMEAMMNGVDCKDADESAFSSPNEFLLTILSRIICPTFPNGMVPTE